MTNEERANQFGEFVISRDGEYNGIKYALLTCDNPSMDSNQACMYTLYDDGGECVAIGQRTEILPFLSSGTRWEGWIWRKCDLVMHPYIPLQVCNF